MDDLLAAFLALVLYFLGLVTKPIINRVIGLQLKKEVAEREEERPRLVIPYQPKKVEELPKEKAEEPPKEEVKDEEEVEEEEGEWETKTIRVRKEG